MKVNAVTGNTIEYECSRPTDAEIQNEYDFLLTEQMARQLLAAQLITEPEYEQIVNLSEKSFRTLISRISA